MRQADNALTETVIALEQQYRWQEAGPSEGGGQGGGNRAMGQAQWRAAAAELPLEQARAEQIRAREAIQAISQAYHPYHLDTARGQSRAEVRKSP
jgi:hypothetical protein